MHDSISLILCAGYLGLHPVYLSECASQPKIAKNSLKTIKVETCTVKIYV